MALPTPLTILLLDQVTLTIKDAAVWSRKHVLFYDGTTYRNTFPNHQITVAPSEIATGATYTTDTASIQVPGTPGAATVVNTAAAAVNSRVYVDDVGSAIAPRYWAKVRTRVEFWDGVIGHAMTMTVTTVSGNATVTVGSNLLLTPGQAISGAGIPTGATIQEVPVSSTTTVILSHLATASASVEATLTGSNYVGGYWEDEELGDGESVQILQ